MSNFTFLDGGIVGVYLIGCMIAGIMARKYVGKVEQFLVAGREMNLYLGIASLAATEFGIVTCMYSAELGYNYGFAGATPGIAMCLAALLVGWTGFCIKPLRDAGVMTIPELFQKQYGGKVRWLSGVVIVLGGLLNMGVFLRVGGDFLVTICGASADASGSTDKIVFSILGMNLGVLEITMTVLLIGVAAYTMLGGMISILITDYLQFIVMSIGLIAVTVMIFFNIGWDALAQTVEKAHGAGGFNPFVNEGLGWDYVLFFVVLNVAVMICWQTIVQRVLSAKDSKTGLKIYRGTSFFFACRYLLPAIWGIAAMTTLGPEVLASLTDKKLAMPIFLGSFLPIGMMGIVIAAMLAADMSSVSAYMLTWGSVIYNDVLAPWHKNKWSQKKGLLLNRSIIAMIGIFLLFYGLWYEIKGDVMDYLGITGTIYLSSMSVLLIAVCYWKRANDWGAFAAIIVGATMPIVLLVLQKTDKGGMLEWMRVFVIEDMGTHKWGIMTFVCAGSAMVVGTFLKELISPGEAKGATS
jgi:solute:Na+ symporter, SSS family